MSRLVFILCFVYASSAFATIEPNYADWSDFESSCGQINPDKPCWGAGHGGATGSYESCRAKGTQRCRYCAQTRLDAPESCVYIASDAYCGCSVVQLPDGSTSCQTSGSCIYSAS